MTLLQLPGAGDFLILGSFDITFYPTVDIAFVLFQSIALRSNVIHVDLGIRQGRLPGHRAWRDPWISNA